MIPIGLGWVGDGYLSACAAPPHHSSCPSVIGYAAPHRQDMARSVQAGGHRTSHLVEDRASWCLGRPPLLPLPASEHSSVAQPGLLSRLRPATTLCRGSSHHATLWVFPVSTGRVLEGTESPWETHAGGNSKPLNPTTVPLDPCSMAAGCLSTLSGSSGAPGFVL